MKTLKRQYLLGFDIGTYESKGTLCTTDGTILATSASKHKLRIPQPGYGEHDPLADWWEGFKQIIGQLLGNTGIDSKDIIGIGCSAIAVAATPVDENCNPLRNAILYGVDVRSQKQADELNEKIGPDKIRAHCGMLCSVESYGPKVKWIRDNEPEIYRKARYFTFSQCFLTAKLTGNYYIDVYSACGAGQPLFDENTLDWNDELCSFVVPREKLPKIAFASDVIGKVTREAARETGLCEGTPVICGTTDAAAEALSVGIVDPGDTMVMYGSSIYIIQLVNSIPSNDLLWHSHYILKDTYSVMAGMATTGSLTRWLRDTIAQDLIREEEEGKNAYDELFAEVNSVPPGSDGVFVLPYFSGERMPIHDPKAKGMIFGLNLSHTRGHIMRAALEGIGYGLCQNLDLMRAAGGDLGHVVAVGGGTKSREWMQIMSDVCQIEQLVPQVTIGASYGDALLAGIGVGAISSPREIKARVKTKYKTVPDPHAAAVYNPKKKTFADLYLATRDIMRNI
jgi:xylulokinase